MRNYKNQKSRVLSVLLSIWLCIALMPMSAFAAEGDPADIAPDTAQEEAAILQAEEPAEEPVAEVVQGAESGGLVTSQASGDVTEPTRDASATACEHEWMSIAEVAATCESSGHKAYRQCSKCQVIYDATADTEVDFQSLVIPALGHKWQKTAEVAATVAKAGKRTYTCSNCGGTREEVIPRKQAPSVAKAITLDGNKLQFKTNVARGIAAFMNNARITRTWVKGAKTSMKFVWSVPKNLKKVDGVIILRKDGKSTVYKEIKRIPFKTSGGWSAKNTFVDTTAKKKNTAYTYLLVTYVVQDGYTYLSHCSDWASGQTTKSKLKNAYTANINYKNATIQCNGKLTLKITHKKPKKTFNPNSVRWSSDNSKVAKVSKGVVTAVAPGTTTIRGRLASGSDVTCKVTVIGAYKPAAPKVSVDIATESSVTLIWNAAKFAKAYDVYVSDDGTNWQSPIRVTGTSKTVTGLTKGQLYRFIVVSVNINGKYTARSGNSNAVLQRAEIKRRATTVTGWPTTKSVKSGTTCSFTITVTSPTSRKASLQMLDGSKWETMKTITLPAGAGKASVKLTFPDDWWGDTTKWRLMIPSNASSEAYTSKTLTLTATRKYQNPSKYVQIGDKIDKHGYSYYVSKVLVNSNSTKSDHIEALITTANKYKGDKYVNGSSGAPGKGIDASGLVIQSCYGAGVDLWPISPSTRPTNCVPKLMSAKLANVTYTSDHRNMTRGDLIFFETSKGVYGHVAIYLGLGKIIHASLATGKVETSTIDELIKPVSSGGKYGYPESTIKMKRIFN